MRVLFTALSGAEQPTGICRAAVNLVRALELASTSCEVIFIVGNWQWRYFDEQLACNTLNCQVASVNIANNALARNWWYASALPRLASEHRAELVHAGFPVPVFRERFQCPLVTTLHDLYPYDRPENFGYPRVIWNRAFLRQSLRASDRMICVSKFTQTRLRHHFPLIATKSVCIPNEIAPPVTPSSLPGGISTPFVLAVAQHRANKRLDLLVRVFRKSITAGIFSADTRLVIVGAPGPETPRLRAEVVRLSLQGQVLFLANLTDPELSALYTQCELYISFSDIEGFGLPIVEALQSGARVLASDIAAHREVGGDRCEYVQLGRTPDFNVIVNAIQSALRRPQSEGPRTSRCSFTGERVLSLYRDLILKAPQPNEGIEERRSRFLKVDV